MPLPRRPALLAVLLLLAAALPVARAETVASVEPAVAAAPASALDRILAAGAVRIGTTGDYRPFSAWDPAAASFEGLDIDLARSLAAALGVRLELVRTSWPTLMDDLAAGRFDLAMGGISVTLERQKKAFFSSPLMRDGKTPIARCGTESRYATLDSIDQPGTRVIVNPGGTNEKFVRAYLHQAEIMVFPDNVTIFDQLVQGKADVMITDAVETRLQQKLHPELCAVHPEQPFDFSEKALLLPRDSVLKEWVDQWLHRAMMTGEVQAAVDKWLK